MNRVAALVLVPACLVVLLTGCSERNDEQKQLLGALKRTALMPHKYVYKDMSSDRATVVQGVVEDDFRYKARVLINGHPALDEVVSDDALADRFENPGVIPLFLAGGVAPKGGDVVPAVGQVTSTDATASALEPLQSQKWVLDENGAPPVIAVGDTRRKVGDDPIIDSLTVMQYVDTAVQGAFKVRRFNKEDLEYKAKEDPFPHPARGSGVVRYDLVAPFIPRPNAGGGANQAVPGANHFRKLSVYVRHGLVIQVREKIDVVARLHDLARNYGVKFPQGQTPRQQAEFAIKIINAIRTGQGNDPIRIRDMTLDLEDLGVRHRVTLPTDVVPGNLSFLRNRGIAARVAPGVQAGTNGSTSTTVAPAVTTTAAG